MEVGWNALLWKALGGVCQVLGLKRAAAATVLSLGGALDAHGTSLHHSAAPLLTSRNVAVTSHATTDLDMPWTQGDHSLVCTENHSLGFLHPE